MVQNDLATHNRVAPVELAARIVTLRLAETFVISRESSDEDDVVQVELRHDGVTGFGEGAPIERYESEPSAVAYLEDDRAAPRRRPVRARGDRGAPAGGENAARAALDGPCTTCRESCSACPSGGCSGCRGQARRPPGRWLGDPDDMARRAEGRRSGSAGSS